MPSHARAVDLTRCSPYADHLGDGIVQLSFTLPVPLRRWPRARRRWSWRRRWASSTPEVVHYQELTEGYTYFVMFGAAATQTVDYAVAAAARASTSST